MSPEQLRGEAQTTASDLYGLGVLLYEMIYGEPPFKADGAGNPLAFVIRSVNENIEIPSQPAIPSRLRSLLTSLLEKTLDKRARSADAIVEEVESILAELEEQYPEYARPPIAPGGPSLPSAQPSASTGALPGPDTIEVQGQGALAEMAGKYMLFVVLLLLVVGLLIWFWPLGGLTGAGFSKLLPVVAGVLLAGAGVGAWFYVPRFLRKRKSEVQKDAGEVLLGARGRDVLNTTLALEVEALLLRCRRIDERILGMTLAGMIGEYESAKDSDNRQAALMNATQLLEKLMTRLSPWYVRHEKLIALVISIIGVVSGILTTVNALRK
jgi:hypothetical protein